MPPRILGNLASWKQLCQSWNTLVWLNQNLSVFTWFSTQHVQKGSICHPIYYLFCQPHFLLLLNITFGLLSQPFHCAHTMGLISLQSTN